MDWNPLCPVSVQDFKSRRCQKNRRFTEIATFIQYLFHFISSMTDVKNTLWRQTAIWSRWHHLHHRYKKGNHIILQTLLQSTPTFIKSSANMMTNESIILFSINWNLCIAIYFVTLKTFIMSSDKEPRM